ncbi:hypothetical protein GC163_00300 [bacterium]|nr:hypothetical protein [bacterium]
MNTWKTWGLLTLVAASVAAAGNTAEAQWGSIKGRVILNGPVPEAKLIVKEGDNAVKDAAVCAAQNIPNEELVVDPETKGIANVVVYLPKAPSKVNPDLKPDPVMTVLYDQKGCRFLPHIAMVQAGQKVQVINSDGVAHNTRGSPVRNQGFNVIIAPNDEKGIEIPLKIAESVPMQIGCDIHPWMRGWWVVTDHPYAAVTAADGTFEIKGLPAGEHEFRVWQEKVGYVERKLKVVVKADAETTVPDIKAVIK